MVSIDVYAILLCVLYACFDKLNIDFYVFYLNDGKNILYFFHKNVVFIYLLLLSIGKAQYKQVQCECIQFMANIMVKQSYCYIVKYLNKS